jgi:hypothetical protein
VLESKAGPVEGGDRRRRSRRGHGPRRAAKPAKKTATRKKAAAKKEEVRGGRSPSPSFSRKRESLFLCRCKTRAAKVQ